VVNYPCWKRFAWCLEVSRYRCKRASDSKLGTIKVNTVVSNVNVEQLLQRLCLVLKVNRYSLQTCTRVIKTKIISFLFDKDRFTFDLAKFRIKEWFKKVMSEA
jgi:hypothetical protein